MTREAYKTLMQRSLRLKQALTSYTDLFILEQNQLQAFKDLLEPVFEAASNFEKERKLTKKKTLEGNLKEMGRRVDQVGTEIYNWVEEMSASREPVKSPEEADILLSQIRFAAHRIIQSADDGHQDENNLIRRLRLVTSTSVHLTETGQTEDADEVLLAAADLETALTTPAREAGEGLSPLGVSCVVDYYLGRVDIAIKQELSQVGSFFVDKAIDLVQNHTVSTAKCREIATKCWEVGDDVRIQSKGDDQDALQEAVGWLYRGSNMVEWLQKQVEPVNWVRALNIAIHRSLVRCHLVLGASSRDALEKAKALFYDLTKVVDSRDPKVACESNIFNLRLLQMSDAPAAEIDTCINVLLSQLVWSQDIVEELLAAFAFRDSADDTSGEALKCIFEAAESSEDGSAFSQEMLLALFTYLRSYAKSKSTKAMRLASSAIDLVANSRDLRFLEGALPACETIVWGLGDHFSGEGQNEIAAQWFELTLQPVFQRGDLPSNQHILRRKAALCYIQSLHLAKAQEVLRPCPQDQAATQYLNFLVALYQNKDWAAIQAVDNICRCPDLQPVQLQLMVSMADEVQNRPVLIKALSTLSHAIKDVKVAREVKIENFTLIRTMVRLILNELGDDQDGDVTAKVETLIHQLDAAHDLFVESLQPGAKANDVVWLYKSAFNMAVKGGKTWPPRLVACVFDKVVQLMEDYNTLDRAKDDVELYGLMASGYFAVLSGKIFEFREMDQGDDKALLLGYLQGYLPKARAAVERALGPGTPTMASIPQMEKMIDVYHVELCCEDQDWDNLDSFIKEVMAWPVSLDRTETFEMIMDIASRYASCPSDLTWQLNHELHKSASLETPSDVARYARSTRALLTSQAHDKTSEQRMINIMDHAISILQGPIGQQGKYPEEEGVWLLSTAFNRGLDCFDEDDFEGAQLWNSIAKDLGMVVRGGDGFKDRINEQEGCVARCLEQ